jgi:small conductance mechanosensitive channel
MAGLMETMEQIETTMVSHGREMLISLLVIVGGLVLIKWTNRWLETAFGKLSIPPDKGATIRHIISLLMFSLLAFFAATMMGIEPRPAIRFISILSFTVIGVIVTFRPFLPALPFKVGNTIKVGDLLGKVEAITVLNTRLRTFDGATLFIPNRKILGEIVINFQFTPTRRLDLEINITNDQDLMKAKQIIEIIMTNDRRVHITPRPIVHVMSLKKGYIELQGRGWTNNLQRFLVNRELLEKTKLRFDQEGIKMAIPQMQIHHTAADIPRGYMED